MATQMVSQTGGSNLFGNNGNFGISLDGDMYGLHDLSKADIAAPRLIMLANVALTGEVSGNCCDYILDEERQMAELTTVNDSFSDSEGERMEELHNPDNDSEGFQPMDVEPSGTLKDGGCDNAPPSTPLNNDAEKDVETPTVTEDKNKCIKSKPFRCKPCQYRAENEEEFVLHIKSHSAKPFIDNESPKSTDTKDSDASVPDEADFSKGPIRCDRCGYNTNRFDHYLAHLKHHNKVGENERVYKCTICTYTTVSEYHWKKHLRNHFPRIVYTCSQCSYFSDRKNNYIQHIRTHTGERPYQCVMCPYSSSQKTHLTRHMRTHSGEKPFKCEQCSYVASNQHEVTRHARQVHNGPKPLTCPHCKYKTADRSNFKKHVELHVNPRQFLCPVCDYAASKKCNLQYHIKSRHSGCADITMDVSKVKLRTKKVEVGAMDSATDIRDEKENTKVKDTEGKKSDKGVKVEKKENVAKLKKQISDPVIGQVTRSSRRSSSLLKSEGDEGNVEIHTKPRCGKRKAPPENQPKINEVQTTTAKKKKLAHKQRSSEEVVKKPLTTEASHKLKGRVKKNKENKISLKKQKKKTVDQSNRKKTKAKKSPEQNLENDKASPNEANVHSSDCHETTEESPEVNTETPARDQEENVENGSEERVACFSTASDNTALPLPSETSADTSNESPTENKDSAEEDVNPCTILLSPDCSSQITEKPDIHVTAEVVEVPESTGCVFLQDEPMVLDSNSHDPVSLIDSTAPEQGNTSESTCGTDNDKHDKSKENCNLSDLETNDGNLEQNVQENACHLDTTETPEENSSENTVTLAQGEQLEGDDKSQYTSCDLPVNKEMEEEKSEEISNFQGNEEFEQEKSENPGNLEMTIEPNELDTPNNSCASEINEKSLEKVESIATQDLTSECCTHNLNDCEPKDIQASVAPCKTPSSVSIDPEEDEGIHSHDGSDISDNVSERSDDSGLNGVASVKPALANKSVDELNYTERNISKESFVCIFCDRSFKKEEEYTKHLKRHLVNVYYLEKAAQGQ